MKLAFKSLISYCLTVIVLITSVACEWNLNRDGEHAAGTTVTEATSGIIETQGDTSALTDSELTIPEQTTSNATASDQTLPEESIPQETTTDVQISTPEFSENTTEENITPEEITTPQQITEPIPQETTSFEEVTTQTPSHEHKLVNGQCECGFVLVVENESLYDNDKDGCEDIFEFSAVLPEKFDSKNTVCFGADEFDTGLSSWVGKSYAGDEEYYYCRNDRKSCIVYVVEVAQAGVYEMAILQRMKDTKVYGAQFTIGAEGAEEYSFAISYRFDTEESLMEICESATMTSYMFGIRLELAAGVNYIKIELASGVESGQYFRDFYLLKISE